MSASPHHATRHAPFMCAVLLAALTVPTSMAVPAHAGVLSGVCVTRGQDRAGRAAIVWVDSLPERVERRLAGGAPRRFWRRGTPRPEPQVIRLQALRFVPSVSAVAVGGGLIVRNADQVWHGVFSVTPGQRFEIGKRAPGRADTLHFDRPGPVSLRCDIHPDESARVFVTPNHAFARTDRDGHWVLPDLPSGTYPLRAWWPDGHVVERTVTVRAKANPAVRFERSPRSGPTL